MGRIIPGIVRTIRYRFLLIAGIFPYLVGSSIAYHKTAIFHLNFFAVGLSGIFLALLAVEYINEYFDSRIGGTDHIFSLERPPAPLYYKFAGFGALLSAFFIAVLLTIERGYPIMLLSLIGAIAIFFYLGPPLKLSHRGFGEVTIALSYGVFMTMGGFYLQAQRMDSSIFGASILASLFILALTLANEIPDYYQDRLAGKRNIVVRLGRLNTARLFGAILILTYTALISELIFGVLPPLCWLILLTLPIAFRSFAVAMKYNDQPPQFIPAIRGTMAIYLIS
ncbi:MAG: prenyltransferase, partial [Candidatus Omnitrophota bacterium]|nr:prenyltransferase [Candidatus Omnitrophota bacterium]